MNKVYLGQSKFTLSISTGYNLTGSTVIIGYKNPDSDTIIELTPTGITYETGVVLWESPVVSIFQVVGEYRFWVKATYADTRLLYSEPIAIKVYNVGE
jgi:hypothetical protein